ncbi:MAG: aminoacyl-tRNA hydrolase [Candidatus Omnitrophica bacterium]|nr:aminoacyl-tRNA hydrolase [Candidatus Omnitrophota bacterium]
MKLIVGLGNPGILYRDSRHNIGFQVVRYLAKVKKTALKKERGIPALSAKARLAGIDLFLAIPLTFMNLSGGAVRSLLKKYKIDREDLLVICDDLDLAFGRIKLQPAGSSAGHRGITSIIDALGSSEFCRMRIGIGRPEDNQEASDFVLAHFNKRENSQLPAIIKSASDCCRSWVAEGVEKSMNIFNRKEQKVKGVKA